MHNPTLDLAPFGRWTLRDEAAQRRSAPRWASTMRANCFALISTIGLLFGCAHENHLESSIDPFAGTYRFHHAEEGAGYFVVRRHSNGNWYMLFSLDGKSPATPFPSPPTPAQLIPAPPDGIKGMFLEKSPLAKTACLAIAPSGPAVICSLPKSSPYQLINGMSRPKMIESKTGYVLIVLTPAGSMTFDLDRTP